MTDSEIEEIVANSIDSLHIDAQRVLVIIPDKTRTIPLPLFFRLLTHHLLLRVHAVDFLVALGTHPPLSDESLLQLVGITAEEKATIYSNVHLFNHAWEDPNSLITLGVIPSAEIEELSSGLLKMDVPVRLNKRILDYDHILICGPVFPHEVVGFSGGNKYFFPGIAGADVINFTHWLGALMTSYEIIGRKDTPMRRVIDRAAAMVPRPCHALCSVITHQGVEGLFFGDTREAWSAAADLSARVHIHYFEKPFQQVLSILPEMYNEIWVGAKGMYKVEPIVADGGEVILYAPHIREISATHGILIREIGYHVRDYFVKQWDRFKHIPWGVLAHSTHLRGIGAYNEITKIETPRIQVTLATGIPEEICRAVNLGYRDPATIDPEAWSGCEAEGILVVARAGETLYRLRKRENLKTPE
jgi:nickel-dependent lactate racemase